ncbi:MAG: hypothetical protein RDV48_23475 [Candidatus Eremiobacteraeota bacterium]|nr:hypothetical protein [Candidatus Eremiobacteraeota bacterium]
MNVLVNGHQVALNGMKCIGKGGEADVYDIGSGLALKLFKDPSHPDYDGLPMEQEAARMRLLLHQQKLPSFPQGLPESVVSPGDLVSDPLTGFIFGYTMKLINDALPLKRFSSRASLPPGTDRRSLIEIFTGLHRAVAAIHRAGIIIGDFNDLNVLVKGDKAFIIDADSFQYGPFPCTVFTSRFVDPLICDPLKSSLFPVKPFTVSSDWYAYSVLLFQSLLLVDPYGGVYTPADPSMRLSQDARPLKRITVFDPEVRYPRSSIHYSALPDEVVQYFQQVFLFDRRGEFPLGLLRALEWKQCPSCGMEHARTACPQCMHSPGAASQPAVTVRGDVTVTRLFSTRGELLAAVSFDGRLLWLCHEAGRFVREEGKGVTEGTVAPTMRFGLCRETTVIGQGNRVILLAQGKKPEQIVADVGQWGPTFATNGKSLFWCSHGQLLRKREEGHQYLGDVLEGGTDFWAGPSFGFGFYRAGTLSVAFVFDTEKPGINDRVKIPFLRGKIIDARCYFTDERCWFIVARQEGGKTVNSCAVILRNGDIEALAEAESGDGSWLSGIYGKCAYGSFLLSPTDDGIVRCEPRHGGIAMTREFPDTEGALDDESSLFSGKGGIFVVSRHSVSFIRIR